VVDVDDVVSLLLLLAVRLEAVGEAFFAAGPDQTTLEKIQDLRARELGVRPHRFGMGKSSPWTRAG
jgi:hypothetical protein